MFDEDDEQCYLTNKYEELVLDSLLEKIEKQMVANKKLK
jgi:hypothetical protein